MSERGGRALFVLFLLVIPFVFGLVVGFILGWSCNTPEPSENGVEYVLPAAPATTHDIKGRIVI